MLGRILVVAVPVLTAQVIMAAGVTGARGADRVPCGQQGQGAWGPGAGCWGGLGGWGGSLVGLGEGAAGLYWQHACEPVWGRRGCGCVGAN